MHRHKSACALALAPWSQGSTYRCLHMPSRRGMCIHSCTCAYVYMHNCKHLCLSAYTPMHICVGMLTPAQESTYAHAGTKSITEDFSCLVDGICCISMHAVHSKCIGMHDITVHLRKLDMP